MGNQHTGKVWDKAEEWKLIELFPRTDTKELTEVFKCSVKVIQNKAHKMGIRKDPVWLADFKSELAKQSYAKAGNSGFKKGHSPWNTGECKDIHRPKKDNILTANGFQEVKVVPGGRIIRHMISDVRVR